MIDLIFIKTWPLLVGMIAVIAAWVTGRRNGEKNAENKHNTESLKDYAKSMEIVRDIQDKYENLSDDDIRKRAIERMQRNAKK